MSASIIDGVRAWQNSVADTAFAVGLGRGSDDGRSVLEKREGDFSDRYVLLHRLLFRSQRAIAESW
jgi:hypothetical protein